MDNLEIYDAVREVPASAQKSIQGGRLKGMTDINPMWRIKALTEQFGACGIGWKYEIADKRLESGANEEVVAVVDISLYVKNDGEWSAAIPGTGGSMFVAKERNGLYTSDEAFKMALTDALSVSCKALGVGADIYWSGDRTKYSRGNDSPPPGAKASAPASSGEVPQLATPEQMDELKNLAGEKDKDLNAEMSRLKEDGKVAGKRYKLHDGTVVISLADYNALLDDISLPF